MRKKIQIEVTMGVEVDVQDGGQHYILDFDSKISDFWGSIVTTDEDLKLKAMAGKKAMITIEYEEE